MSLTSHPRPERGLSNTKRQPVAPLACTYCRNKHLRCDGGQPNCGRCRRDERNCQYLPSRRGYRGPKKSCNLLPFSGPTEYGKDLMFSDYGDDVTFGEDIGNGKIELTIVHIYALTSCSRVPVIA